MTAPSRLPSDPTGYAAPDRRNVHDHGVDEPDGEPQRDGERAGERDGELDRGGGPKGGDAPEQGGEARGAEARGGAGSDSLAARWPARTALAVLFLMLLVVAFGAGRATAPLPAPADASADAGFARDMQAHHTQAVEMSLLVRDRTSDEQVRTFAYDLALTQQHQVGQLFGFLVQWGLPQEGPVMAWMHAPGQAGSAHHTVAPGATATASSGVVPVSAMPGMASAADLRRLRQAGGRSAEILYLRLMIAHHRGGVEMARALLERNPRPEVARLARSMVAGQTAEIAAMQQLLRQRGVATA